MKLTRWFFQMASLFLQTRFFVETVRLYLHDYVIICGQEARNPFFAMLSTLLIVIACELVSLVDLVLFFESRKNKFRFVYLGLFLLNALFFMTMAYYSTAGTVVCMVSYGVLYVVRLVNWVLNSLQVGRELRLRGRREKG